MLCQNGGGGGGQHNGSNRRRDLKIDQCNHTLVQLLLQRELPLSHEAYEPQLMAWLVYIYRTKCYAKTEGEEEDSTMAATDVAT
ncbi:hypothetical protein niasHT_034875 [Heterodera trifolii]|uniref:Uncharacterized protein n=1 Tax=Heterodera trifolii TaxID=157864 RepID=A0ABD2I3X2_9BILA